MKKTTSTTVNGYIAKLSGENKTIGRLIKREIDGGLKGAESKIWHGGPVWFIEGNPIVACTKLKDSIQLLFFSGQTFKEPGLRAEGSFKAADIRYVKASEVNTRDLRRWLKKAKAIQCDYKNIVKRRGRLLRIK